MTRIFLTGGSGFVALHILQQLLEEGHSVVTSVRTEEKGQALKKLFSNAKKGKLDYVIVKNVAVEGAFDNVIESNRPFEIVIHTASPFHEDVKDVKKEFLDPAIIGTIGLLKAVKKHDSTVKRVVMTSSFAAICDAEKGNRPGHTYSEKDWNPVTEEDAIRDPNQNGYSASKTLAEKKAWEFVETQKPNFSLATINPPLVFGPVHSHLANLHEDLNTSNQRIREVIYGKLEKSELLSTRPSLWVDVRDVARAHLAAAQVKDAANKRFFVVTGFFKNREIVDIVRNKFPDLAKKLPIDDYSNKSAVGNGSAKAPIGNGSAKAPTGNGSAKSSQQGSHPEEGIYGFDNSRSRDILGIKYKPFSESLVDTVKSLEEGNHKA